MKLKVINSSLPRLNRNIRPGSSKSVDRFLSNPKPFSVKVVGASVEAIQDIKGKLPSFLGASFDCEIQGPVQVKSVIANQNAINLTVLLTEKDWRALYSIKATEYFNKVKLAREKISAARKAGRIKDRRLNRKLAMRAAMIFRNVLVKIRDGHAYLYSSFPGADVNRKVYLPKSMRGSNSTLYMVDTITESKGRTHYISSGQIIRLN